MTDEQEKRMNARFDAVDQRLSGVDRLLAAFGEEVRDELRALRRGVEFIGERLFGPSGKPEFQSHGEADEFRSRMRRGR